MEKEIKMQGRENISGIVKILRAILPKGKKHNVIIDGNTITITWRNDVGKKENFAKKVLEVLSEPGKAEDF